MPPSLSEILTVENAYVFRITHRDNVAYLLQHGVHCRNSTVVDPNFVEIGNPEIIDRRRSRRVPIPPGGTLSDYVPFYFTPRTPMLHNIVSGWQGMRQRSRGDVVVLVSSLKRVAEAGATGIIADRNATLAAATFSADHQGLAGLVWDRWQALDYRKDPNDSSKLERYQAEALVHHHLPVSALSAIITYDTTAQVIVQHTVSDIAPQLQVLVRSSWYP